MHPVGFLITTTESQGTHLLQDVASGVPLAESSKQVLHALAVATGVSATPVSGTVTPTTAGTGGASPAFGSAVPKDLVRMSAMRVPVCVVALERNAIVHAMIFRDHEATVGD